MRGRKRTGEVLTRREQIGDRGRETSVKAGGASRYVREDSAIAVSNEQRCPFPTVLTPWPICVRLRSPGFSGFSYKVWGIQTLRHDVDMMFFLHGRSPS